jgi:hypothetical protein
LIFLCAVLVGCGSSGGDTPTTLAPAPDLAITDAHASPASPVIGNTVTFTFTVSNVGTANSGASTLTLYKKSTADASFVSFDTANFPTIVPGAGMTLTVTTAPVDAGDVTTSPCLIKAVIATAGDSNAANNSAQFSITFVSMGLRGPG